MKFTPRQKDIINAATELIGERGVQRLTTKSLAEKIGFSEPALYRHFRDKNEILRSILLHFKDEMGTGIKSIIHSDFTGIEKLKEIISYQFDFFVRFPAVIMVIFSETSFQDNKKLSKTVKTILDDKRTIVYNIVKSGQEEGTIRSDLDYRQIANIIMGSMRVTVLNWRLSNYNFDLKKESEKLVSTIEKILTPV